MNQSISTNAALNQVQPLLDAVDLNRDITESMAHTIDFHQRLGLETNELTKKLVVLRERNAITETQRIEIVIHQTQPDLTEQAKADLKNTLLMLDKADYLGSEQFAQEIREKHFSKGVPISYMNDNDEHNIITEYPDGRMEKEPV